MKPTENLDNVDLQTEINQLLDLLVSSQLVYENLKHYCMDPNLENCFKNISFRRGDIAGKLMEGMEKSYIKIDKRTHSSTKGGYPHRPEEVDLIHHFTTLDSLLQQKYKDLLNNPECPALIEKILEDYKGTIETDNEELSTYILQ